jgi:hypothetical protein
VRDEELAGLERKYRAVPFDGREQIEVDVVRLIAEVRRLRAELDEIRDDARGEAWERDTRT